MLINENKLVDNNQQARNEEKKVNNFSNQENMEDQNNIEKNSESNTLLVTNLNYNEMKNTLTTSTFNNTTLKDMIQSYNFPANISTLHQALQDAETKLAQCNGVKDKTAQKRVRKAQNDLKAELQKTLLPTPIEEWEYKEEEGKYIIKKSQKMVILAFAPSLMDLSSNDKLAMDIVNDDLLEKNSSKYLTSAGIFANANIVLTDLNGNTIPANTPDVRFILGGYKDIKIMQAIHKLNINALAENSSLHIITNVENREFTSVKECARYISTNTLLDRGLKGKEKINLAALATEDEFMKKICEISEKEKMPISTAMKYYASGKILTNTQINKATRGVLVETFKYNLMIGDRIIETLSSLGFHSSYINKRYFIDAFTKYQNAVSPQTKQPNGLEKAMEILEKLTTADAKYIQGFNVNQVDSILILLQSKSDNQ